MLKYEQDLQNMIKKDRYVSSPLQQKKTRGTIIHGTERKTEKTLHPAKPKIVEPVDADPKPKLFRIDWQEVGKVENHRYVTAIDKTIALTLFDKKYGKDIDIVNLSVNRVPHDWNVRWPVMWDRIGLEIEDTHKDKVIAARAKEREDHVKYKEWHKTWVEFWASISETQGNDYKMWVELRKVKYNDWLNEWVITWNDIGNTKWENRSMFDYLEIDQRAK